MDGQHQLWIGYTLPDNPDLEEDSRWLEGDAIHLWNVSRQSCAIGNDPVLCEQNAEKAFRLQISDIPEVQFKIYSSIQDENIYLFDLKRDEAIDPLIDFSFNHIEPRRIVSLGIKADIGSGQIVRSSDNQSINLYINYQKKFMKSVCKIIEGNSRAACRPINPFLAIAPFTIEEVNFLLDHNIDVNTADGNGITALMCAAAWNQVDIVKYLISKGADINLKNSDGITAVMYAAHMGWKDVAEILIDKGADVNTRDNNGLTPLAAAARQEYTDLARFFINSGGDINANDNNGISVWKYAALKYPINPFLNCGSSANTDHQNGIVKFLLDCGIKADINDKDKEGKTALFYAISEGDFDDISYLVDHGVDVNAGDYFGKTPLMYAVMQESTENFHITSYLLDHKANVNTRDHLNNTALQYAVSFEIRDLLISHGATIEPGIMNLFTLFKLFITNKKTRTFVIIFGVVGVILLALLFGLSGLLMNHPPNLLIDTTTQTNDAQNYYNHGSQLLNEREISNAIAAFDRALAIDPNNIDALNGKGNILLIKGDYSKAAQAYDKVLTIDSNNIEALNGKGKLLYTQGKYQDAIQYFDRVLAIEPENYFALCKKGEALIKLGRYQNALQFNEKALTNYPDDPILLLIKGESLAGLGKHQDAISYYDLVLQRDKSNIDALNAKGLALIEGGRYRQAVQCFESVLIIDPNNPEAKHNKGQALSYL